MTRYRQRLKLQVSPLRGCAAPVEMTEFLERGEIQGSLHSARLRRASVEMTSAVQYLRIARGSRKGQVCRLIGV
jgi:hypothetical protein